MLEPLLELMQELVLEPFHRTSAERDNFEQKSCMQECVLEPFYRTHARTIARTDTKTSSRTHARTITGINARMRSRTVL